MMGRWDRDQRQLFYKFNLDDVIPKTTCYTDGHGFERLRLRGLSGARDEFHLAAMVQNLKTMTLRLLGPPRKRAPA